MNSDVNKTRITAIPIRRILDRLDACLEKKNFDEAERLLKNWAVEAEMGNDLHGKLTMLNEQIGLYRKLDREAECLAAIDAALELVERLGAAGSVEGATAYLNAATGYKAFSRTEQALELYGKAQGIYEKELAADDDRLAGLYNNMALALVEVKRFDEARSMYGRALEILDKCGRSEANKAITYLNMADMVYAAEGPEAGEEAIENYLEIAEGLLDSGDIERNGYYAFVCEKCAPVFGFYGHFLTKQKLLARAGELYERS